MGDKRVEEDTAEKNTADYLSTGKQEDNSERFFVNRSCDETTLQTKANKPEHMLREKKRLNHEFQELSHSVENENINSSMGKWNGRNVFQIKERLFGNEIDQVVCSEKLDLIVSSDCKAEVGLLRLNLENIWSLPPPYDKNARVEMLSWRSDGKLLGIAYSVTGETEDTDIKGLVLLISVENVVLKKIQVAGKITCLSWFSCSLSTKAMDCLNNYFPILPAIPHIFCYEYDNSKLDHRYSEGMEIATNNFLVVGSHDGNLLINIGEFVTCCNLNINDFMRHSVDKYFITKTYLSHDMKSLFLFVQTPAINDSVSVHNCKIVVLDTEILSSKKCELSMLNNKYGQIFTFLNYLVEIMNCVTETWEHVKVAEATSNVPKYIKYFKDIETFSTDMLELLTFGNVSDPMEKFLLNNINCTYLKDLDQSIQENLILIYKLIMMHIKPTGEKLNFVFEELKGLSELGQFKTLGLSTSFIWKISAQIKSALIKSLEVVDVIEKHSKKYSAFLNWLREIITYLKKDENQTEHSMESISEANLNLIADYLYSLNETITLPKGPMSFFQHIGQYFETKELMYPLQSNSWQTFLEEHLHLGQYITPTDKNCSLSQALDNLKISLSTICSKTELAVGRTFCLKKIIELPINQDENYFFESHYFEKEDMLMVATAKCELPKEIDLTEVDVSKLNTTCDIKTQKLKFDFENNMKCLSIKWYLPDMLMALFQEEQEQSCLLLVQVFVKSVRAISDKVIELNATSQFITVWKINSTTFSNLAVSGGRKCGFIVSKNKKKIKAFEMGDSIESDD